MPSDYKCNMVLGTLKVHRERQLQSQSYQWGHWQEPGESSIVRESFNGGTDGIHGLPVSSYLPHSRWWRTHWCDGTETDECQWPHYRENGWTHVSYNPDFLDGTNLVTIQCGNKISNKTVMFRQEFLVFDMRAERWAKLLKVMIINAPHQMSKVFTWPGRWDLIEGRWRMHIH